MVSDLASVCHALKYKSIKILKDGRISIQFQFISGRLLGYVKNKGI